MCLYLTFDRNFFLRIQKKCFWCHQKDKNMIWFNRYPEDWHKYYNMMICNNCYDKKKNNII